MSHASSIDQIDGVVTNAVYSELTVGLAAVELKVGGSVLDSRFAISMQAKDSKIYWGYDNSVTTTTGTRLYKGQFLVLPIGYEQELWLIADTASLKVSIGEFA